MARRRRGWLSVDLTHSALASERMEVAVVLAASSQQQ
jgi:hypothetical protein